MDWNSNGSGNIEGICRGINKKKGRRKTEGNSKVTGRGRNTITEGGWRVIGMKILKNRQRNKYKRGEESGENGIRKGTDRRRYTKN